MNRNLISIVLILSLMGCTTALDFENGVELRPGEATAERLFEQGIGQPWVGGNSPSSNAWGWGYDPFSYYSYQGKTYRPHLYYYYLYPDGVRYPLYYSYDYLNPYIYPYYSYYWSPYNYHSGYWWSG